MGDLKLPKGSPGMGPLMWKQRKKQVKDEVVRLKLAEKKKRCLEKQKRRNRKEEEASAAIRSELEKKKQKKKEEQQRLDEEGAAIAEAVALHVLMEDKFEDSCLFENSCLLDKGESFFLQKTSSGAINFFPAPSNTSSNMNFWDNVYCMGSSWGSESFRSAFGENGCSLIHSLPHRFLDHGFSVPVTDLHLYEKISGAPANHLWNPTPYCDIFQVAEISGLVASQAIASLKITEDVCSASLTTPDTVKKNRFLW